METKIINISKIGTWIPMVYMKEACVKKTHHETNRAKDASRSLSGEAKEL